MFKKHMLFIASFFFIQNIYSKPSMQEFFIKNQKNLVPSTLNEFIKDGGDINELFKLSSIIPGDILDDKISLLMYAGCCGFINLTEWLLKHGASIEIKTERNRTLFDYITIYLGEVFYAWSCSSDEKIVFNYVHIIRLLLEKMDVAERKKVCLLFKRLVQNIYNTVDFSPDDYLSFDYVYDHKEEYRYFIDQVGIKVFNNLHLYDGSREKFKACDLSMYLEIDPITGEIICNEQRARFNLLLNEDECFKILCDDIRVKVCELKNRLYFMQGILYYLPFIMKKQKIDFNAIVNYYKEVLEEKEKEQLDLFLETIKNSK